MFVYLLSTEEEGDELQAEGGAALCSGPSLAARHPPDTVATPVPSPAASPLASSPAGLWCLLWCCVSLDESQQANNLYPVSQE